VQNLTREETAQLKVDELRREVGEVVIEPDRWLMTPHDLLGGREPIDLLTSGSDADERMVRDLVDSIKHGFFT
jgi:uncharacterized protein (DUF2384 family)